jgi:hypothetical protein
LYFSSCCDSGCDCHSTVLCGDHHCDVVWWSRWSELGGAPRDVVDVVWWSRWSELGGAARDVVDVVGARRSRSGCGRRGLVVRAQRSRSGRGRRGLMVRARRLA